MQVEKKICDRPGNTENDEKGAEGGEEDDGNVEGDEEDEEGGGEGQQQAHGQAAAAAPRHLTTVHGSKNFSF